jgi:hypothetical protein
MPLAHAYAREAEQQLNTVELVSSLKGAFCRIVFARAHECVGRVMYEASRAISVVSWWLRESVIKECRFLQQ